MRVGRMTYKQAIANADHLVALGDTTVYIEEDGAPWGKATRVEASGSYRLNGPCGVYIVAEESGLTLRWPVDFEDRGAGGRSISLFDRTRLRAVSMKLPPVARAALAAFLQKEVLPALQERTAELREAMNLQLDSEDCVRGLIAFAASKETA